MKKIEAVIRPERLAAVKAHLAELGIDGRLMVSEVSGLEAGPIVCDRTGKPACPKCVVRTLAAQRRLKLELIVGDRQAHRAVDALLRQARSDAMDGVTSGNDGHVTVLEVSESLCINAATTRNEQTPGNHDEPPTGPRNPSTGEHTVGSDDHAAAK